MLIQDKRSAVIVRSFTNGVFIYPYLNPGATPREIATAAYIRIDEFVLNQDTGGFDKPTEAPISFSINGGATCLANLEKLHAAIGEAIQVARSIDAYVVPGTAAPMVCLVCFSTDMQQIAQGDWYLPDEPPDPDQDYTPWECQACGTVTLVPIQKAPGTGDG